MRYPQIAAAVAAILSTAAMGAAAASTSTEGARLTKPTQPHTTNGTSNGPDAATAQGYTNQVYIGGSSAAAGGLLTYFESANFCAAGYYTEFDTDVTATNYPDFRAVSCASTVAASGLSAGTQVTVYVRPEGGSVIGVLGVYNSSAATPIQVKEMNLANAGCSGSTTKWTCNTGNATIGGTAAANGSSDTWGVTTPSSVTPVYLNIGIADLEPDVFGNPATGATKHIPGGGNMDPILSGAYNFLGNDVSANNLKTVLTQNRILQQVFGYIASKNLNFGATADLPRETLAAIFSGTVTDWNKVNRSDHSGPVAATSTPIVVCNREVGSGTRAETDIWLTGDGCETTYSPTVLKEVAGHAVTAGTVTITEPADNYQTLAEMDCVNGVNNAIGYVSIDNFSKITATVAPSYPNTQSLTVDGVIVNSLNAAIGLYSDTFEAFVTESANDAGNGTIADNIYSNMVTALQTAATTTNSAHVNAIPGIGGNVTGYPPISNQSKGVYVSNFTRQGNSCSPLQKQN
jgi:ABC-type phosphate transport system substrate-binding protein